MIPEIISSYRLTLDYLRRLVADVPDATIAKQAGAVVNHPAWVIGHLIHSSQAIGGELGLQPWLPDDWATKFGTGSVPTANRAAYPSKAEFFEILDSGQRRVLDRLVAMGEGGLTAPLPDARFRPMFPTLGHAVLHVLTVHAALHVGQITVWRRAVGLGPISEHLV